MALTNTLPKNYANLLIHKPHFRIVTFPSHVTYNVKSIIFTHLQKEKLNFDKQIFLTGNLSRHGNILNHQKLFQQTAAM